MKRTNVGAALALILCLGATWPAHGSLSCKVLKLLEAPEVRDDANFWESFAKISAKGEPSEANVLKLLEQHGVKPNSAGAQAANSGGHNQSARVTGSKHKATVTAPPSAPYSLHAQAAKDLAKIQSQHGLKAKFEKFLELIPHGAKDLSHLKDHSNGWDFEPVRQFGPNHHSVRLNHDYRVVFEITSSNEIVIKRISNTATHNK